MKILSVILLLSFTYTLSFAYSSALSGLRQSERSATLKSFKTQMKSRLSNSATHSRHRSSSTAHNNRFLHQNKIEMKKLSSKSSTIQNSAISTIEHYEKVYEELDLKHNGNKKEILDELEDYHPFKKIEENKRDEKEEESHFEDFEDDFPGLSNKSVLWRRR